MATISGHRRAGFDVRGGIGFFPKIVTCAALCVALTGCDLIGIPTPGTPGQPAPIGADTPPPQSAESLALSAYYARVQQGLLTQGLLRQDGGGPDVPFTARNLVDDFVRIGLYSEFTTVGGRIVARQTESRLRKWSQPIKMRVEFGATVPLEQREFDRATLARYLPRLSRLIHQPIQQVTQNANFHVFIVNEDERRQLARIIPDRVPNFDVASLPVIVDMPRATFCQVFAIDAGDTGTYTQAIAVIRAEHPDRMRTACIHEEIAQGLGLANDSPKARPSVFNDDEEFGLLTHHDELLLQMLYDPRMVPGMSPDQARKVAEVIAAELMPGQS